MKFVLIQAGLPHLTLTEIEWLYSNDSEFKEMSDQLFDNVMREIDA